MCDSCNCITPYIVNSLNTLSAYNSLKNKLLTVNFNVLEQSLPIEITLPDNQSSFFLHPIFLSVKLHIVVDWVNDTKKYQKTIDPKFLNLFRRKKELNLIFGFITLLLLTSNTLRLEKHGDHCEEFVFNEDHYIKKDHTIKELLELFNKINNSGIYFGDLDKVPNKFAIREGSNSLRKEKFLLVLYNDLDMFFLNVLRETFKDVQYQNNFYESITYNLLSTLEKKNDVLFKNKNQVPKILMINLELKIILGKLDENGIQPLSGPPTCTGCRCEKTILGVFSICSGSTLSMLDSYCWGCG